MEAGIEPPTSSLRARKIAHGRSLVSLILAFIPIEGMILKRAVGLLINFCAPI